MVNVLRRYSVLSGLRRHLTSKSMAGIKTFVFLDLETTGLPYMEYNKTKITELCAIAVQSDHIELGCFPRVHNKLSFCFNPNKMINPESSDITGLSNELLEHQTSFTPEVVEIFTKWLETNKKPICFVAHNGDRFDYPILRAEVGNVGGNLPEDLLCIDSLSAFKAINEQESQEVVKESVPIEFDDGYDEMLCQLSDEIEDSLKRHTPEEVQKMNETTPKKQMIPEGHGASGSKKVPKKKLYKPFVSYKLQDVYTRLTNKQPVSAHEAEGDVVMLITCAAVLGEKFVSYANENTKKFVDIPPMTPGKRLGF